MGRFHIFCHPLQVAQVLIAVSITGCGGGGGGGEAGGSPSPAPVNTNWSQQAYIKAPNAQALDRFGTSVAISGDTLVVSARDEASNQTMITNGNTASADNSSMSAGAAYVFVRSGASWRQQAYLKASNAQAGDRFGYSVAISGDTIVVGAQAEDSSQTTITNGSAASADNSAGSSGAAYVFVRNGSNWSEQAYLKAGNADAEDAFGTSVAVNGDTIVVGAPREASNQTAITNGGAGSADNSLAQAGAAYVFVRSGTSWSQQAYLKASNTKAEAVFGVSVAISGDTIVVGAPDEASSQTTVSNGSGASADSSAPFAGAAYVFVRGGNNWSQQAYLKAPNTRTPLAFGKSVAISGNTIVVGGSDESSSQSSVTNGSSASPDTSAANAGAAYVFVRSGTSWSPQAYLKAANAEANDFFGTSVAISGDTIVVGSFSESSNQTFITNGSTASVDNSAPRAGAAYVFARSGTSWSQQAYLKAPNAVANANFGLNVAIDGDTIAAGAESEPSNQTTITNGAGASADTSAVRAGAAYVVKRGG
jgi:FG-GAP repeat